MFTPRYIKQAKLLLRHTQKYLRYKSDVMEDTLREDIDSGMRRLQAALRQRDRKQIESARRNWTKSCTNSRRSHGSRIGGKIAK